MKAARYIKSYKSPFVRADAWHPETDTGNPVQEIIFPKDKSVSELYIRLLHGYMEFDNGSICIKKGARLSTNTYFNSFYEDYWKKYTSLDNARLVLQFKGSLSIEIFRDTKNNGCNKIEWRALKSKGEGSKSLQLPLCELGQLGRIFVDISAEEDSEIYSIEIKTDNPPERQPRVTFGICTFNREEYLLGNLAKLVEYSQTCKSIARIIVVNQGAEFRNPKLKKLVGENEVIDNIHQGNLGGCGGFARTMHEAMNVASANYHILMDDDIQIDPGIITNLIAFMSFLTEEIVIGGHMLDLLRPWFLYEAGAMIKENTRITPMHHNIDLRGVDSLIPFNNAQEVDYNAWWFCAIPTKYLREARYPAPIFIRGDDMEYGIRLKKMGVPTVAMPGIAVWHEPFYIKAGGWQTYYDYRNRLIMASVYPDRFKLVAPFYMLWIMMKALAVHDYQTASLVRLALVDFMKGPALFDQETSEQIHGRVTALNKKYQSETVDPGGKYKSPRLKTMPKTKLCRYMLIARRLLSAYLHGKGSSPRHLYLDKDATPANIGAYAYVKTNGIGSYNLLYCPDRKVLFSLFRDCFAAFTGYRRDSLAIALTWGREAARFRDGKWWEKVFDEQANRES
jgi:galactofuranosylgalactofuranosylrhamnosyl-N-acetylglucosaminyl-diphospho-decaprenol beta-1,5/1,6-galactofuranosyltransferase